MIYYHVTVASNFCAAYDKYSRIYSKARRLESSFPDKFFLLKREELGVGIAKATLLLKKLGLAGDRLVVLKTEADENETLTDHVSGLGRYVRRNFILIDGVEIMETPKTQPRVTTTEEVMALSFSVLYPHGYDYELIRPRSVSLLPVAMGCQAACPFCFSKTSASKDTPQGKYDWNRIDSVLKGAHRRGASRAVITGGGEPGLVPHEKLTRMIGLCSNYYDNILMISNGYSWAVLEEEKILSRLKDFSAAGLSRLGISRHHHERAVNARLMNLDTKSENIAKTWRQNRSVLEGLELRWICVLQKGGVADRAALKGYLDFAAETGVADVCFKELYVSTSVESEYHSTSANDWSRKNQVSLKLILDCAAEEGWTKTGALPWGAPVFETVRGGRKLRIAAYTEPSLLWERHNGLCRSWNMMADGRVLASLEDRRSEVFCSKEAVAA